MRFTPFLLALALTLASSLRAQETRPPDRSEAAQLIAEITDLMEASAIVVPELARAGAPLTENVRQAARTLELGRSREHVGLLNTLLANAKVYLQLVDALPKPPTFSRDVRRQIESLREKVDLVDLYFRSLLERREQQALGSDRDNLARYRDANSRLGPPGASENRVVFFGDSITDSWKLNQFFPGKPFINRGISGQITGQMLGRMQADVIRLEPRVMVLLAGTNDLARNVALETIENNITMIADLAVARGVKPVIAALLPVSDYHQAENPRYKRTSHRRPDKIVELNRWIGDLCRSRGFVYLDYYSALADSSGMLDANLGDDGLHPNAEGYKVMAPLAQQAIDEALRTASKKKRKKRFGVF